jgi:hypothetical protein
MYNSFKNIIIICALFIFYKITNWIFIKKIELQINWKCNYMYLLIFLQYIEIFPLRFTNLLPAEQIKIKMF